MGFFHTIFLSDSFRPVRPLPFGNPTGGGAHARQACVGAGFYSARLSLRRRGRQRPRLRARGGRIPTPVCGLARNDTAARCWADRVVRPYGRATRARAVKRRAETGGATSSTSRASPSPRKSTKNTPGGLTTRGKSHTIKCNRVDLAGVAATPPQQRDAPLG